MVTWSSKNVFIASFFELHSSQNASLETVLGHNFSQCVEQTIVCAAIVNKPQIKEFGIGGSKPKPSIFPIEYRKSIRPVLK